MIFLTVGGEKHEMCVREKVLLICLWRALSINTLILPLRLFGNAVTFILTFPFVSNVYFSLLWWTKGSHHLTQTWTVTIVNVVFHVRTDDTTSYFFYFHSDVSLLRLLIKEPSRQPSQLPKS